MSWQMLEKKSKQEPKRGYNSFSWLSFWLENQTIDAFYSYWKKNKKTRSICLWLFLQSDTNMKFIR
jgi:hypothetical protein